ncbi:hypothetical protein M8C13_04455 [Crossiella sp. SN42]|uniref:hypothetical protein n=1 Tax=Crossiella sp. SN42 TaxID=2944808 RepID=UPI00207C7B35|nr:hypothetical protein [Crossiella sp. SN42]MCO1575010.1 hypothetical protein [Crossiella sp. SN42]
MSTCPVEDCDRPTNSGLCHDHRAQLAAQLRAVATGPPDAKHRPSPGLAAELRTTAARLDRIGSGSVGVISRDAERPLPWGEHAAQALAALHHVITGWMLLIHDDHQNSGPLQRADQVADRTTEGAARWLLDHSRWTVGRPDAARLVADVNHVVRRAERTIDRAPDRFYAGPCATPDPDTGQDCTADLYSRHVTGSITCRACGAEHDAGDRRAWLRAHARDHLDTAPAIARALSVLCLDLLDDTGLSVHRIRQWATRGHLTRRGQLPAVGDRQPQPLYRVGDVEQLLVAAANRTRKAS